MVVGELRKYLEDIDYNIPVLFQDGSFGSIEVEHIFLCTTAESYLLFTRKEEDLAEIDEVKLT